MQNPFIEALVTQRVFATPFANNLTNRRKALGMLQFDLAVKLDVSKTSVTNWETGFSLPSLETFVRLCSALKVTPNALLGIANNEFE